MFKTINKIAFLAHEPSIYAHYSNVWAELEVNSFVIVLLGALGKKGKKSAGVDDFLEKVNSSKYEIVYLEDLILSKTKYRFIVSNHIMGGRRVQPLKIFGWSVVYLKNLVKLLFNQFNLIIGIPKVYKLHKGPIDPVQFIPLQAGLKQVRFMYGADVSDAWSLDAWNEIYDLFLCHGPNDEFHLKKRFTGKTILMGYPRYDEYFRNDLQIADTNSEFSIDKTKKTILWMPTLDQPGGIFSSIPFFANKLSELASEFNFIVRPHPIALRTNPELASSLKGLGFLVDTDPTRNMNKLFKISDVVLCDQGGSAFGALYLEKRLILLELLSDTNLALSSNADLKNHFPIFREDDDIKKLQLLISDDELWKGALLRSREIKSKYFLDTDGKSAAKAADILKKLPEILY